MKLSEIILLLKKGYTRAEIEAMEKDEQTIDETETESSKASIGGSEVAATDEKAETDSNAGADESTLPNILNRLADLEKSIQKQNISKAEMDGNEEDPESAIIKFLEGGL